MTKPPHNLKGIAALLADKGRNGDTMLAHINPQEAAILKAMGGSGTINPETGLPEYWGFRIGPIGIGSDYGGVSVGNVSTGSIASSLIGTVRSVTGGTADAVQSVASKLGQTVEAIASDPRKLAAVAVMVAFPGAAAAVGEFLLPEAVAATLGATGTAIAGQTVINTALNKGDVDAALKAALIQQGVPALTNAAATTQFGKDIQEVLGKYGAEATTQAGVAAIMKKDPVAAFLFSGASSAVGLITDAITEFKD
jgi:arginine repressor